VWLHQLRMDINQMSCAIDGSVRTYMEFYPDRSDSFLSIHSVEPGDDSLISLVRDKALIVGGS
jgi:hypothetical protein